MNRIDRNIFLSIIKFLDLSDVANLSLSNKFFHKLCVIYLSNLPINVLFMIKPITRVKSMPRYLLEIHSQKFGINIPTFTSIIDRLVGFHDRNNTLLKIAAGNGYDKIFKLLLGLHLDLTRDTSIDEGLAWELGEHAEKLVIPIDNRIKLYANNNHIYKTAKSGGYDQIVKMILDISKQNQISIET